MRKLSAGPLFVLILVYLWTHFASAQDMPTALPAKKGANASAGAGGGADASATPPAKRSKVAKATLKKAPSPVAKTLPAKKGATPTLAAKTLPAKKVVALPAKRKVVVVTALGVAKTLPAKSRVVMNFDKPALPEAEAVVVREAPVTEAVNESANDVEEIRRRDVTEAATLMLNDGPQQSAPIEIPNTATRKLRPALPDSDSYVALPAGLQRTPPQQARVALAAPSHAATIVAQSPTGVVLVGPPAPIGVAGSALAGPPAPVITSELAGPPAPIATANSTLAGPPAPITSELAGPPAPVVTTELAGPPAPIGVAGSTLAGPPAPVTAETSSATTTTATDDSGDDGLELNLQYMQLPTDIPTDTTSAEAIRQEQEQAKQGSGSAADFVGPLAPLVNTQPRIDIARTETEEILDHEKGSRGDSYETHVAPALSTTFLIPHDETPKRRIFIRGGYLNAQYNKLEPDLRNGATTFGVSASQVFSKTEVRIGIDIAHGMDQEVSLRNTRMAMFRAEGLYSVWSHPAGSIYVGGALGGTTVDVNSYRQSTNDDVVIRENAKGSALLVAPEIGGRVKIGRQLSLDLTAEYLLLAGSDQISNLGGLLGEAALGFRF